MLTGARPIAMTFANSHAEQAGLSDAAQLTAASTEAGQAVRRVCVIGNSFIGAMFRAYRDGFDTQGFSFSFFASAGPNFEDIAFEGHAIANALITSGDVPDMTRYDLFVIHGDLPAAHDAARFAQEMPASHYSDQVRRLATRDWMQKSKSARLAQALTKITSKPIFLISRNLNQPVAVGPEADNDEGAAFIGKEIAPAVYIPFPAALFGVDRKPKAEYYKGSVDVFGEEPDRTLKAGHHISHFNQTGGALMLAHILDYLRKT